MIKCVFRRFYVYKIVSMEIEARCCLRMKSTPEESLSDVPASDVVVHILFARGKTWWNSVVVNAQRV